MNETLTKLQTVSLSSTQSSVSFSNIPQTYTDLVVKISARSSAAAVGDNLQVTFNGSSSGYTGLRIYSNPNSGSSPLSYTWSNTYGLVGIVDAGNETGSTFSNIEMTIPNYTSNNYKIYSVDSAEENVASANAFIEIDAMTWANTAPITSMTFAVSTSPNTFASGSEFTLYGVKNLANVFSNSIKATGGAITTDGNYVYHTFTSTGAFTPTTNLLADVLMIAGGGGGGGQYVGGGGGAGGVAYTGFKTLSAGTSYVCTIGSGGAGAGTSAYGGYGNNTTVTNISTAAVGGGGGAWFGGGYVNGNTGNTGGSGGGGSGVGASGYTSTGGSNTSGQGNLGGGSAFNNTVGDGGGGGGGAGTAGQAGGNGTTGGGNGGNGTNAYAQWLQTTGVNSGITYIAAGGGGGTDGSYNGYGGLGGGGNGSNSTSSGSAGVANTGSGGGGGNVGGGSGASGLVIIRYKA